MARVTKIGPVRRNTVVVFLPSGEGPVVRLEEESPGERHRNGDVAAVGAALVQLAQANETLRRIS